jgi:hypothetical protein
MHWLARLAAHRALKLRTACKKVAMEFFSLTYEASVIYAGVAMGEIGVLQQRSKVVCDRGLTRSFAVAFAQTAVPPAATNAGGGTRKGR